MTVHAFLDTNIFLHFRSIDEVDWVTLLGAEDVTLVVAFVVMSELDTEKNENNRQHIRKRARSVTARIERWLSKATIRDGVSLRIEEQPPSKETVTNLGLDYVNRDERLIASVLSHEVDTDCQAVLVSDDTGTRLRARQLGLTATTLPNELRIPNPLDDSEKEIGELRTKLARLKDRLPQLDLVFTEGEKHFFKWDLVAPPQPPDVRALVREIEEKLPPIPEVDPVANPGGLLSPTHPSEVDRYRRERAEYLEAMERYLELSHTRDLFLCHTLELALTLKNDGNGPANDIDIKLHIPGSTMVEEDLPEAPAKPSKPDPPRSTAELMQHNMRAALGLRGFGVPHMNFDPVDIPNPTGFSGPTIEETDSHSVGWHLRRLKQHLSESIDPIYVTFGPDERIDSFEVDYSISCVEHPEVVTGTLTVVVNSRI